MKRGKLFGLAILAVTLASLPGIASAAFYTTFTNAALSGPYQLNGSGTFVDANDDEGRITLNGVAAFSGTGGVTIAPQGLTITISESGSEVGGLEEFQHTCATALAAAGSNYVVNSDGTGTLTLALDNGGGCFNTTTATTAITVSFDLALSENFHGGTHNAASTTFANLCMTGSTSGFSPIADCATTGQDSIDALSLNATLVHQ